MATPGRSPWRLWSGDSDTSSEGSGVGARHGTPTKPSLLRTNRRTIILSVLRQPGLFALEENNRRDPYSFLGVLEGDDIEFLTDFSGEELLKLVDYCTSKNQWIFINVVWRIVRTIPNLLPQMLTTRDRVRSLKLGKYLNSRDADEYTEAMRFAVHLSYIMPLDWIAEEHETYARILLEKFATDQQLRLQEYQTQSELSQQVTVMQGEIVQLRRQLTRVRRVTRGVLVCVGVVLAGIAATLLFAWRRPDQFRAIARRVLRWLMERGRWLGIEVSRRRAVASTELPRLEAPAALLAAPVIAAPVVAPVTAPVIAAAPPPVVALPEPSIPTSAVAVAPLPSPPAPTYTAPLSPPAEPRLLGVLPPPPARSRAADGASFTSMSFPNGLPTSGPAVLTGAPSELRVNTPIAAIGARPPSSVAPAASSGPTTVDWAPAVPNSPVRSAPLSPADRATEDIVREITAPNSGFIPVPPGSKRARVRDAMWTAGSWLGTQSAATAQTIAGAVSAGVESARALVGAPGATPPQSALEKLTASARGGERRSLDSVLR